jgi:hypothetical protein
MILQFSLDRIPICEPLRETAGARTNPNNGVRMGLGHALGLGACDLHLPIYRHQAPRADRNFQKKCGGPASQPVGPGVLESIGACRFGQPAAVAELLAIELEPREPIWVGREERLFVFLGLHVGAQEGILIVWDAQSAGRLDIERTADVREPVLTPWPDFHAILSTLCCARNDNCQRGWKRDQRPSSRWDYCLRSALRSHRPEVGSSEIATVDVTEACCAE